MKELIELWECSKKFSQLLISARDKANSIEHNYSFMKSETENFKSLVAKLSSEIDGLEKQKKKIMADLSVAKETILGEARKEAKDIVDQARKEAGDTKALSLSLKNKIKEVEILESSFNFKNNDLESREKKLKSLQEAIKNYE